MFRSVLSQTLLTTWIFKEIFFFFLKIFPEIFLIQGSNLRLLILLHWKMVNNLPAVQKPRFNPLLGRSLEKEMATHTSILSWRIPWTEKPGGLQSTGSQRIGHDWAAYFLSLLLLCVNNCWAPRIHRIVGVQWWTKPAQLPGWRTLPLSLSLISGTVFIWCDPCDLAIRSLPEAIMVVFSSLM